MTQTTSKTLYDSDFALWIADTVKKLKAKDWERTISRTQQELSQILEDSPSLRNYLMQVMDDCYQKALRNMHIEYHTEFPDECLFPQDVDDLLTEKLWK